jgi:predicted choloylglycine hydrolase
MHIRNLDWPLESMRNTTIIVNYIHDDRVVVAATYPGLVGVLSGMVKDKFSITLNWVDPVRLPGFEFGPLFLVRWVLEHAADFQEAVEYLAGTTLSCSALFMVTGPEKNEACVIERTDKEAAVRFASGKSIAVANHYICDEFIHLNSSEVDPEDELEDFSEGTEERYNYALGTAKKFKGKTLQSAMKILSDDPVNNFDTVQRIAFNVSTGEFIIR